VVSCFPARHHHMARPIRETRRSRLLISLRLRGSAWQRLKSLLVHPWH
jgi:hypothetical protein